MVGDERPSIVVLGPGSIGGAIAVALSQVGPPPVLAGRQEIRRITVEKAGTSFQGQFESLTDPTAASRADVVFVAVKAHQTHGASPWLEALVDEATTVFVCQNGVEHLERIRPYVPAQATVVPVIVDLPAARRPPETVEVGRTAQLAVALEHGHRLEPLLEGSFVTVQPVEDWLTTAWNKLVFNAAIGGICTLTRSGIHAFRDEELASMAEAMMAEIIAVGRAEGADLDDRSPAQIIERVRTNPTNTTSSIVRDRIAGLPTEWDARNAVIARKGRQHNMTTPINDLVTALLRAGEPVF